VTENAIDPEMVMTPSDDVLVTELDGEKVLFVLETGDYANLNKQGGAIWDALAGGNTINGIVETLCARFNVSAERCRADVETYCRKLIDGKLVSLQN